jgi:hypothetical protein
MESKYTEIESLFDSRFGSVILIFRLVGIPFKITKNPTIYSIYVITVIVCSLSTCVGMFIDVYIRMDDLRSVMATARVLSGTITAVWIWIHCR